MDDKIISTQIENVENTSKKEEKKMNSFSDFMKPEIDEAYEEILSMLDVNIY